MKEKEGQMGLFSDIFTQEGKKEKRGGSFRVVPWVKLGGIESWGGGHALEKLSGSQHARIKGEKGQKT